MRCFAVLVVAVATICVAQHPPELAEVGASSAIIFRGTVLAVTPETTHAPGEVATARITFRIDDGIRGVTTGETLTIRQWNVAPDEYRLGETLVLFLHAPSDGLGLSSPVGGRAGHRRVEEVPAAFLSSLRSTSTPAAAMPAPPRTPSRPSRSAR